MNQVLLDRLVRTLLYEGYLLYPYRASALKNQRRFCFGTLYPRAWAPAANERSSAATEILVRGGPAAVEITLRFLRFDRAGRALEEREALGRVALADLAQASADRELRFEAAEASPPRSAHVALSARRVTEEVFALAVRVTNTSELEHDAAPSRALEHALGAAHLSFGVTNGELVSLLEPPAELADAAKTCSRDGLWPVLVGAAGARDTMLAAPIILYDYPAIAPESPNDFFDATEIDELLTLRISTLTSDEKRQMREADPLARSLLDRVEALSEAERAALHGAVRSSVARPLTPGTRVRLAPRGRADAFDLVLAGRLATVRSIEQDLEDRVLVTVTVDDDPGQDLGATGVPGHRFFFRPDELEPVP